MRYLPALFVELLWLAGAALVAWYFLLSFLGVETLAAAVTLTLRHVERKWQ